MSAELAHDLDGLEVHVTPMLRRHLRSVLRIEAQVYPRPWTLGLFMSELSMRDSRIYRVARVGHDVVGYAGLLVSTDEGHITTVAVDPAWHRRSIGTRLVHAVVTGAIERGCANLTLEVRMSNTGAQSLYRRFGFAPAGVRKNYYAEVNEDGLVMWAHDVHQPQYAERLARIAAEIPGVTVIEGAG